MENSAEDIRTAPIKLVKSCVGCHSFPWVFSGTSCERRAIVTAVFPSCSHTRGSRVSQQPARVGQTKKRGHPLTGGVPAFSRESQNPLRDSSVDNRRNLNQSPWVGSKPDRSVSRRCWRTVGRSRQMSSFLKSSVPNRLGWRRRNEKPHLRV